MTERSDATNANARLMTRATQAAVATAMMLVAVKLVTWLLTGSVAMLSTLVDSVLDVLASLLNLLAVRHALLPADLEHRFGHGKAEALSGLGQAAFIAGSAVFLLFAAGQRAFAPVALENSRLGIGVMVFSMIVTLLLVRFQRAVIRRTGSVAISADSLHYVSDVLVNVGVILAFVLVDRLGWTMADPALGGLIAVYILYSAWRIARGSFNILMDRELDDAERARIHDIAMAHPDVLDLHDLRTRSAGQQLFIQLHLEMDPSLTLLRAHEIADAVEAEIHAAFPGAEVLIHEDPAGIDEERASFTGRTGDVRS